MLSKVNKVNKDNPIFACSFIFCPHPPRLFWPPSLLIFQTPWSPPFILTPPFLMNLRVQTMALFIFSFIFRNCNFYNKIVPHSSSFCSDITHNDYRLNYLHSVLLPLHIKIIYIACVDDIQCLKLILTAFLRSFTYWSSLPFSSCRQDWTT